MGRPTKVEYQGKILEGEDLDFEVHKHSYDEYKTEDGAIIRLSTAVTSIVRTKEYTDTGDPLYIVRSGNIVSSFVPDELKRKSS